MSSCADAAVSASLVGDVPPDSDLKQTPTLTITGESTRQRRPLKGAAERWEIVEDLCSASDALPQRFRPPRPERRVCRHFTSSRGCAFGDRCTHLHADADGALNTRALEGQDAGDSARPLVCLHKMEDRKVGRGSISLLLRTLETGGFHSSAVPPEEADLLLANAFPPPPLLAKLPRGCTINHFPGEHELGAKDRMARLLRGLPWCPLTFVLPDEAHLLRAAAGCNCVWIVKPCQMGEGRHIRLLRGLEALEAEQVFSQHCVVSEYVSNPLLITGQKADLRVYVLVTRVLPDLQAFIFREGLVRICGEAYDLTDAGISHLGSHVSNNALQTKTLRHACATNWSLEELWRWLDNGRGPRAAVVWGRIRRMVRDVLDVWCPTAQAAFQAARSRCSSVDNVRCYSLLAFDVLVDEHGAAWLLEVNPKPALHAQSASLKAVFPTHYVVKASLLADLFSMVGLPEQHLGPILHAQTCDPGQDFLGFEVLRPTASDHNAYFLVAGGWTPQDLEDPSSLMETQKITQKM